MLEIGWHEWCALPGLGIPAMQAKIDTGAFTSCLHAVDIETYQTGGRQRVRFRTSPLPDRPEILIPCDAALLGQRDVTSSVGSREQRHVITATLALGPRTWDIEVTLRDRSAMKFRMLLGRTGLAGRTLIDPSLSCRLGQLSSDALARMYPIP